MKAVYKDDQAKLEQAEAELDEVLERLFDNPHDMALNSLRRRLEIKIATLSGDKIIDMNYEQIKG